jgi:hypothetical protein
MPLIEILWPSTLAAFALLLAGHHAGGAGMPVPLPSKLQYSFGPTSLVRDSAYMAIVTAPTWESSQAPAPADFDATPCPRLISVEDFTKLWNQLNAIDLAAVTDPDSSSFEAAPPDMSAVEFLRLIIDDKTVINWSRPDYRLIPSLRGPLEVFNDSLKSAWKRRSSDLVLPVSLSLDVSTSVEGQPKKFRLDWHKGGRSRIVSGASPSGRDVSKDEFEAFWSELVQDNSLCDVYRSSAIRTPEQIADTTCSMKAVVNGVTVVEFALGEHFTGRERFDALVARLDAIRKGTFR